MFAMCGLSSIVPVGDSNPRAELSSLLFLSGMNLCPFVRKSQPKLDLLLHGHRYAATRDECLFGFCTELFNSRRQEASLTLILTRHRTLSPLYTHF